MTTTPRPRPDWVKDHIRRYTETNGEDGYLWNNVTTLLLTTKGRKSGKSITTPLIFGRDGDRYLIVASRGGTPTHPNWYLNLAKEPTVQLQVKADKFTARARTATPAEKQKLWPIMTKIWPAYDDYQKRTTRDIPVVILERV